MAEERESSVASSDSIDILRSSDEDDEDHPTVDISRQPILVRGVGQITVSAPILTKRTITHMCL